MKLFGGGNKYYMINTNYANFKAKDIRSNKKITNMKKLILFLMIFLFFLVGCSNSTKPNIYSDDDMWVYKDTDSKFKFDTFFIAPTVSSGDGTIDLSVEKNKSKFTGAVKQEIGIYNEQTRFFAPYYKQANLNVYLQAKADREKYFDIAYNDVKDAFTYYLNNYNNNNGIILAGFSQGADMCQRLLKDFIVDDNFYNKFVACYAIGWLLDDNYLNSNERLQAAKSETDTKVIISFECEAPEISSSFVIGENEKTNSINPLTWENTTLVATKDLNKGAVFINTYGEITDTINNFTGCYIDPVRGVLKVTDVDSNTYNKTVLGEKPGFYHIYDYQFFYNNLKENVIKRINNFK